MNKRTRKIIQQINESVPQELRDRLFVETYIAPDLRLEARKQAQELWEEADGLPDGSEKKTALRAAQRLQNVIDAGYYDAKEMRVHPEVAKEIDAWVDRELDQAIKYGRIPHPKDDKEHKSFIRKLKQHEQRKRRSNAVDVLRPKAQPDDQAGGSSAD